ncbi:Carboxylesterase type B [Staphylococcus aureus]|uniref:Carboxylesterase type B n=1 Tax=Staphylococcus aureus TaxID=1280 RepID=A0A380DSY5_STAAU|nr:Carboxylesterase type B [Staphylococcus aureus]
MGQSAGSMSILTLLKITDIEPYFHKVVLLSGALRLDTLESARNKAQHFQKMMLDYLDTDDVTSLSTDDILMLMAKLKQSRGPSKGLDLIYAPIKQIIYKIIIQQRNQFLHVIQKMKAIFILLVNRKNYRRNALSTLWN